jgi:HD-GYP domain-containing protein (c-di-GMP phosphodiesterase class II)
LLILPANAIPIFRFKSLQHTLAGQHEKLQNALTGAVKTIDFLWPTTQIAHQHHERLDGSGYPLGLIADQIIPEAKIMCVTDVVGAVASHRPCRPARGVDTALGHIQEEGGQPVWCHCSGHLSEIVY